MPLGTAGALAIGAGVSAATGAANLTFNGKMNKKSMKFAEKQSELQYQRSINLMNMQNAYNTPEAQRKRLEEAGLNVGLMYGRGGAGGESASPASPQMAAWNPNPLNLDMAHISGAVNDTMVATAQARKLNAEADRILGYEKNESETRQRMMDAETNLKQIEAQIKTATTDDEINKIKAEAAEAQQNAITSYLGNKVRAATLSTEIKQITANYVETEASIKLKEAQIKLSGKELEKRTAEIETEKARASEIWEKVIQLKDFNKGWEDEEGQRHTMYEIEALKYQLDDEIEHGKLDLATASVVIDALDSVIDAIPEFAPWVKKAKAAFKSFAEKKRRK